VCDVESRVQVLATLAPQLSGPSHELALQEVLAAAQFIRNEQTRAQTLVVLAPQLTNGLVQEGLAAARSLSSERHHARVLASLLLKLPNYASWLRSLRQFIIDHLWMNLTERKREDVLIFCADEKLFAPPILSSATLAAIARHIIEICQEWE
jgi:hypothetical protein